MSSEQQLILNQANIHITLLNTELTLNKFEVQQEDIKISINKQQLSLAEVSIDLKPGNQLNIEGVGALVIDNITATNSNNEQMVLMQAQQLTLDELLIKTVENKPQININQL